MNGDSVSSHLPAAEAIFNAALELTAEERLAYLEEACHDNPLLHERVEALLQAHDASARFLPDVPFRSSVAHISRDHRIGDYEILEEIARGGMGVVFRARQISLNRPVALKMILAGQLATPALVQRFHTEAEAVARLDHPHIVPIYEVGEIAGQHYFSMKLIDGGTLADRVAQFGMPKRRVEPTEQASSVNASDVPKAIIGRPVSRTEIRIRQSKAANLLAKVAGAVHYAHQRGILHRDLKPTNILIDGKGEPHVTDFGLAILIENEIAHGESSTILGTPSYMAPEQAASGCKELTTGADVYSLGAILYELLTGQPPFRAATVLETLREVCEKEPTTPRALNPQVDRDLETICLKCLSKIPEARYSSAIALAEDLGHWAAGRTILARPTTPIEKAWRWARRKPAIASLSAAVLCVLLLAVVASAFSVLNSRRAERAERILRHAAETSVEEKREQLVRIDVANGSRAMESGDLFGALLWFTAALRQDKLGSRAEEMHRYRIGSLLNNPPRLTRMWMHSGAVNDGRFSPDGRWVLTASRDNTARLWDARTGQPGAVLLHPTNVLEATFSADGSRILTLCGDGSVRVWNPASGQMSCPPLNHDYKISRALISPDGRRVFTAGDPSQTNLTATFRVSGAEERGEVRIWDTATGRQLRPPFRQSQRINGLILSPDGQWLAAAWGRSAVVWNLRQPRAIQFVGGAEPGFSLLPGLESRKETGDPENQLPEVPSAPSSRKARAIETPWAGRMAFEPDSQRLLIQYGDGSLHLWSLAGDHPSQSQMKVARAWTRNFQERGATVNTVAFSPDGRRVLVVDDDGTVNLWDARTGEAEGQFQGKGCRQAWFSPDGRFVILSSQIWDMERREPVSPAPIHPYLESAAWSPDGARLLTAGSDGTVRLWSMAGGPAKRFAHDSTAASVGEGPVDKPAAANSREQFEQTVEKLLLTDTRYLSHAAFSLDGSRISTASWNGTARVWDVNSGKAITPCVGLRSILDFTAFSRDGTCFAIVGGDMFKSKGGMARVWDASNGQPLSPIIRHSQRLRSAEFSFDGKWLITHSTASAQVWDARTGEAVKLSLKLDAPVRRLAFSPEQRVLAVCSSRVIRNGESASLSRAHGTQSVTNSGPGSTAYQTQLWNAQTGHPTTPPLEETNALTGMQFSPDGRWFVTFAETENEFTTAVRLWEAATGHAVTPQFRLLFGQSPKAMFTDGGRRVFLLPLLGEPIIWDLPGGRVTDAARWRILGMNPVAVSPDGQRFANEPAKNTLQVHDAATGEPLTPPLRNEGPVLTWGVQFSPDGGQLLSGPGEGALLWPLPKETRSVEDLILLAQLLAGRTIDSAGRLVALPSSSAADAWKTLRTRHPGSFALPPDAVRQWRERIVNAAEHDQDWFAAAFHLDELVMEHSSDESLRVRRARARDKAATEELR